MIKKFFLGLIRFYRLAISPYLGNNCRFEPTCSVYAMQAIDKYGVMKGSKMAFLRILRCNPLFEGGYDPVL